MGRVATTLVGLAVVAIAAIFIAKGFLRPTKEKVERNAPVLTGEYKVRLEQCRALAESEIPEGLPRPKVDEDLLYVEVVLLFPGAAKAPSGADFALVEVNGVMDAKLKPVHSDTEVDDDGAYLVLVFKSNHDFEAARVTRGEDIVVDSVQLQ